MRKKVINAGIYIRVSSTQQAEEGYSLETQERTLKKYCEVMDWNVCLQNHLPLYSGEIDINKKLKIVKENNATCVIETKTVE